MRLFEKLRAELIDIVEWVDDSHAALVWRFPRYHNQIKHGARLVVRPGQLAIFVREGRVADVFEPGQYRLETRNLPVLSTLAGWKHGFDSPFMAEVYFVSTRLVTDLRWGTPNPAPMRDPDFGPIRVRAFGTYTLRAQDPRTLLAQLVGTDGVVEADEVTELLGSIVASAFNGYEVCSAIRAMPGGKEVPILILTSRDDVESVARAYESGATDFATKGISTRLLVERVRFLLREHEFRRALVVSRSRLHMVQNMARVGHWEVDGSGRTLHMSALVPVASL